MKILAFVPDYIEKPSGGLGEQFRQVKKYLEGKVDYYTCAYPENNQIKNYRSVAAPIPNFPHQALTTIYGQSMYFYEGLQFKEDFDIIHAFDWSSFYAGVLASRHFNKPLVCTVQLSLSQLNNVGIHYCHDPNTIDGKYINDLQISFEKFGLENADTVIQVSEYYKSYYPEYNDKTVTICNGIDLNEWVQKRTPKLPGKNKTKICYIGRSSAMKGLDTILKCDIPDDVDFYFIVSDKNAEEPIFSNIKQKANNRNIFHYNGLYGQDKIDFLFAMDGIVMPSIHEPFGIVALESLISKNILITTASGGIKEVLGDVPYLHINNSNDLLSQINFFKNISQEDKDNIVNKGIQRVSQFDWSIQSNKLLNVYKDLVK
jgi:glycosyltransferase involved in cell wall biosynthesis